MDPALHMREQLKQIYRARLPNLGWCDDNQRRKQQVELAYSQVRGDWEAEAVTHYQSVLTAALEASSTDNEHQTADTTLVNDRSFWSSTGHPSQVGHEALLYELAGPACRVASLKLAPYRALYQDGYPVYPPMRLQVWTGPSPYTLQPASPWHDVLPSDALQTFALWPHAPIGRYLQVRMYGKLQKQREDMQFYVAIRHIDASGTRLTPPELLTLGPLLRSNAITLAAPTPSLPATCSAALQAAADYGVGPEQAQGAAGGSHAQLVSAQQEGRQGLLKLVLRPRALRQPGRHSAARAPVEQQGQEQQGQEQQQGSAVQRVTAGIRSILGRRGAAAAAVAGSGEAGPSKRPQQQQQQPQPPPPAPPLLPKQQWQQQLRQGPPLWLADEELVGGVSSQQPWQGQQQSGSGGAGPLHRVEGDSSRGPGRPHSNSLAQAQGRASSSQYAGGGGAAAASDGTAQSSDTGSEGDAAEEVDPVGGLGDAAGQQGQQGQGQLPRAGVPLDGAEEQEEQGWEGAGAGAQQPGAPQAAAAAMDNAAWMAAQRLHQQIALRLQQVPPWQQEQVLAELLADEPAGGRAGRGAYREQLAHLQQQLQQPQQQQGTSTASSPAPRSPPVVAILPRSSSSSSSAGSSGGWCQLSSPQDVQELGLLVKVRAVLDQQLGVNGWLWADSMLEALAAAVVNLDDAEVRLRQRYAAAYHAAAAAAAAAAGPGAVGQAGAGTSSAGGAASSPSAAAHALPAQGVSGEPASSEIRAASPAAPSTPAAAAPPSLAATRLFQWQDPAAVDSSSLQHAQQQWCQPASCFCEGMEADLWGAA